MNEVKEASMDIWSPLKAAEADQQMRRELRKGDEIRTTLKKYAGTGVIKETVLFPQQNGGQIRVPILEVSNDCIRRAMAAEEEFIHYGGVDAVRAHYTSGISYAGELPGYIAPNPVNSRQTYV